MSKRKVLMARREDPEVEAILKDAPPEVDIHFLAAGRGGGRSPRGCRDYLRRDS